VLMEGSEHVPQQVGTGLRAPDIAMIVCALSGG
jgi:hypothetical protein